MMNSKTWASLVTLVFFVLQHQSGVRPADAFAPSSIKHTRSSSSSSSSTALDMTKTSPQQQQKKQLEVTAVASLFALTVATSNPLPSLSAAAAAAADQVIAKPTPQVTVTPFGGGFGGIGLSPFGLNPFGGLGAGKSKRMKVARAFLIAFRNNLLSNDVQNSSTIRCYFFISQDLVFELLPVHNLFRQNNSLKP